MDWTYIEDWLAFLGRWVHVIAAIVWIGTSFYFVALDQHLRPAKRREDAERGVGGETWEVHGGGFYRIEKYRVAPGELPQPLHWFKWEAYGTWLSGFFLLIVIYYLHPGVYLRDRTVADVSEAAAIALSIGLLAVAWLVYDGLCRALEGRELVLAGVLAAWIAIAAWGCGQLFAPRAAYLQVGAMLGTVMVANVLIVIIPAHRKLIRALEAKQEPDPAPGIRAKQRSVHNNYFTLPVLLTMIAGHFPTAYAHAHAWAILVALMAIGAWVRHFYNLRHAGRTVWAIPVTAAVALVALAVAIEPDNESTAAATGSVSFSQVRAIIASRCSECHSAHPSDKAFTAPPLGVVFDTPADIVSRSDLIDQQAVRTKAMPLGNVTGMTQHERAVLAAWIKAGAPTR